MKNCKRVIVIILLFCILYTSPSFAISQDEAGQTIAEFAKNFYNDFGKDTAYSYNLRGESYNGTRTSGMTDATSNHSSEEFENKFAFDCAGWVSFAIHNSLGIGGETYTDSFGMPPGPGNSAGYHWGFEEVLGNYESNPDTSIDSDILLNSIKPGDILFATYDKQHVYLYVGNGMIIDSIGGVPTLRYTSLKDSGYLESTCSVGRISQSAAAAINENNCTTMLGRITGAYDNIYYGTTEGSYAGSYTFGQWLFNKFAGFFDYLAGIITYVFRAQFLGWGNIIEELVNSAINDATGIKTVTVDKSQGTSNENLNENSNEAVSSSSEKQKLYTPSATNTMWSNDRINIEDIIYNRVPILDINFLDVNLDRYKKIEESERAQASAGDEIQVISEDSIVYALRSNIAKWYIVIRQICIIVLLLLLIYLGIRLAISTIASDKAKYKGMLVAWLTSFIVVFCIHYFMMVVIEINEVLVDIFAEASQNAIDNSDNGTGSKSIYDTIRTRAYSLKLSEGFPATIFYMVLIYFLIRFLFIYIKRYFTIMILALMGPIMSLKNCFDKISTGKSKSMSKWMYDFALNVFLQTIHAILYCMFMVIAFDLATNSIAGFIMALIVLNFIFKAEKIFMNIFNFEGRASSLRDVNENKNYFAEAYKVGMGATMFAGSALKFGYGAVAGSGKFLGGKVLSGAQIGTSAFNRLRWGIGNIGARIRGEDSVAYNPIDLREKLSNKVENTKNGMADRMNSVVERVTGERSLRLDLHNIKKRDPYLYDKTKQALKLKKDLKWKTLKRTFGDSTKSIRYMAELMMGVPMLVIDTQSGISTLADATSGLRRMGTKKKEYGYRRKINGRRGNLATKAINAATFGGVNATVNNIEKTKKEIKKLRENNYLYIEIEKANNIEIEIQKEVDRMIADGNSGDIDSIMKNALGQVMSSNKIKSIVSKYMADKGIAEIGETEMNEIIDNINKQLFENNVDKVVNKYMRANKKEKLNKEDFDKIVNKIGEDVQKGVSGVLNDYEKIDNKREEVYVDTEKIAMEYMNEKKLISLSEDDIKEIKKRVESEIESNLYKDVKKTRDDYMSKQKGEEKEYLTAEQIKELLTSDSSYSSFGIETTDEIRKGVTDAINDLKDKEGNNTLDKKKAVDVIEEAILSGTAKDDSNLNRMMRELKTHGEKIKNNYKKRIIDTTEFTEKIKEKLK